MPLAEIEKANAIVIVGSNTRHEQPLLSHRIRKAWKKGAKVYAINPVDFDFNFLLTGKRIADVWSMGDELAAFANASSGDEMVAPNLQDQVRSANVEDAHRSIAKIVADAPSSVVIFGDVAVAGAECVGAARDGARIRAADRSRRSTKSLRVRTTSASRARARCRSRAARTRRR